MTWQKNSILINEHALWVTSRVGYLLFEIIHIKVKLLKEKNLDFFSLNFFTLISYYQK